jgi:hypothetical protein
MWTSTVGRFVFLVMGITLLLTVGGDRAWAAERHVGVLNVRGPGAKRVRQFLEEQIDRRWNLVSRRELLDAAEDLEISKKRMTKRRNLRRIARKAKADAVLTGYVYRARRRWWLALQVRDGGTGRIIKGTVVRYSFFRLNKWTKRSLMKAVLLGVRRCEGVEHRKRRRVVVEPRRVAPVVPPAKKNDGKRAPWVTGLEVSAGIEIWGRRLSFSNLEGEPGSRLLYETNSPVVPISLNAEVYPGAFVTGHSTLANVGLGLYFQQAFGVVSQRENENTVISTTIQRVGGRLLYRWNVKSSPQSVVLKLHFGVESLKYKFGDDLGLVASVTYINFRAGAKAQIPLGLERVKLGLFVAGLAAVQLGQMADAYHYGNARAGGVEAGIELDVRLFWKIHLVAGAFTTWLFVSFSQVGVQGLDYEFIADSARDGYFGGYLLAAFHY